MGFFSELKEDLSQAVNELMPEEEKGNEVDTAESEIPAAASNVVQKNTEENAGEEISMEHTKTEPVHTKKSDEESDSQNRDDLAQLTAWLNELDDEENVTQEATEEEPVTETVETAEPAVDKWEEKEEIKEGKTKMENQPKATDETAVITAGMKITGDIESEGSVDVLGTVNGNITIQGKLNITGNVQGNSMAAEIFVDSARITGEVVSEGAVKVGQSSVILGNITAKSAVIAGAVKGDIDVQGPVVLDTSAIVMGNIKSKAVQINNGAVIEGMCSQCYADVNPSSFFEEYNNGKNK